MFYLLKGDYRHVMVQSDIKDVAKLQGRVRRACGRSHFPSRDVVWSHIQPFSWVFLYAREFWRDPPESREVQAASADRLWPTRQTDFGPKHVAELQMAAA